MRIKDHGSGNAGRYLFLEPFFGGSHRDVAEGLISASRHRIDLMTMSDRFWRWRMGGAALHFVRRLPDLSLYDGIMVSGLMSLTDLKALASGDFPPVAVYFHENQLTYPVSEGERRDAALAWTNVTTALAADRVLFNSHAHRDLFFEALPGLIRLMPDYRPGWVTEALRERSSVIYPGCRFPSSCDPSWVPAQQKGPPLIIWNHRWEYDKAPDVFFRALDVIADRGLDFRVALLGEQYSRIPDSFSQALVKHGDRVLQYGFVPSRRTYFDWLKRGSVVVSTAIQENFGLSVIEAVRCGCMPILPNRLSYPELIPPAYHSTCLYEDEDGLVERLEAALCFPERFQDARERLSKAMSRFSWSRRVGAFDRLFDELGQSTTSKAS